MNLYYISSGIATAINVFLSFLSFCKSKNNQTNLYYALLCFSLAAWTLWDVISVLIPATHFDLALITCRILYLIIIFLPVFYLKFAFSIAKTQENPKVFFTVIFLTLFLLLSDISSFFISNLRIENLTTYSRYIVVEGYSYYLFIALFAFCAIYGVVKILLGYKKASGNKKTQLKYILFASFSAFSASFVYFPTIFGFKIIPIDNILIIFYTTIIAYAIMQHHLLDIEVVIKRTAVYSLLTAILTGIFVSLIMASQYLFSSIIGENTLWVNIAWAFVISLIFTPLRNSIEWVIDRLFFRARYDYQRVLSKYSYSLKQPMADLDRFASLAPYLLTKSMLLTGASVMVLNRLTQAYDIRAAESEPASLVGSSFPANSLLMAELLFREKEITSEELKESIKNPNLPPEDIDKFTAILEEMAKLKAALVIPCISESEYFKKPTLIATINLGHKKSGEPFSREDLTFLTTLANQSVISVEYAFIVEELKKNQALTIRTEKLAAIGTTTAGIAHELKNPLTYLSTVAQILPLKWDDPNFRKTVNEMLPSEIQRMQIIVEGLLSYSRNKELILKPFNLQEVLEKTIALVTYEARKNKINLKTNYQHADAQPLGEANRLVQVFMNLMSNAVQAMADHGGELTISTEADAENVKISFKDSGPGISHINRAKLFDPFFTTKETGTGLGLAISKKIIEEHHGSILVDSVLGRGTVFIVCLPRAKQV